MKYTAITISISDTDTDSNSYIYSHVYCCHDIPILTVTINSIKLLLDLFYETDYYYANGYYYKYD